MKHQAAAAILAAVVLGLALTSGASYRRGATIGAGIASFTALLSLFLMARSARHPEQQMKGALVVMIVAFLVRIVLVAAGAALVARAGENVVALVQSAECQIPERIAEAPSLPQRPEV